MRKRRSLFKVLSVLACTCVLATMIVVSFGTPQGGDDSERRDAPPDVVDLPVFLRRKGEGHEG